MQSMTRHYEVLTATERFSLMIEAMARRDEDECDRLEDSCPRFVYRADDVAFRDRMRRAYGIASTVALGMQPGLARVRMAQSIKASASGLTEPVAQLALAAFYAGRAFGREEVGQPLPFGPADSKVIGEELVSNERLLAEVDELRSISEEMVRHMADGVHQAVGDADASDLLTQWEGFGQFCQEAMNVEPLVLFKAFGLGDKDPAAEVRAAWPDALAVPTEVAERAERWMRSWRSQIN